MRLVSMLAPIVSIVLVAATSGCGKTPRAEAKVACPTCKVETRKTTQAGAARYVKRICPECSATGAIDYGDHVDYIHVCDGCKQAVGTCSSCCAKEK